MAPHERAAGDTHDVIHHGGEVVAVVVPITEYQQLRRALEEQRISEEFDTARASYLARQQAGTIHYVSHDEAGRRLGLPSGELPGQLGDPGSRPGRGLPQRRSGLMGEEHHDWGGIVCSGGSGRPWIRGQSFKLTGRIRRRPVRLVFVVFPPDAADPRA
jgi:hypothetical protein